MWLLMMMMLMMMMMTIVTIMVTAVAGKGRHCFPYNRTRCEFHIALARCELRVSKTPRPVRTFGAAGSSSRPNPVCRLLVEINRMRASLLYERFHMTSKRNCARVRQTYLHLNWGDFVNERVLCGLDHPNCMARRRNELLDGRRNCNMSPVICSHVRSRKGVRRYKLHQAR